VTIAVLVAMAIVAYWQLRQRYHAAETLQQALLVHSQVEDIISDLLDAEVSAKAYLLSGRDDDLSDYYSALRQLPRDIDELRDAVQHSQRQLFLTDDLAGLAEEWSRSATEIIELRGENDLASAAALFSQSQAKPLLDRFRDVLMEVDAEEGRTEILQNAEYQYRVRVTNIVLGVLLFLSALIVILALLLIRRHSRLREAAESHLSEREQRLRLALDAAAAGAWDLDVARQRIRFSGQAARVFGLEDAAEVPVAGFLARLHPDDVPRVSAMLRTSPGGDAQHEEEFRIRRDDGLVRWVHTRAAWYQEDEEPPRIVGIAIDVTRAKTAQIRIEELLAQKETLVHEIDHRVKNSLQLAASTLSAQARSEKDPRVRRGLQQAEQRLFAMAKVHKIIQEAEHAGEVPLGVQIEQLAAEFDQLSNSLVQVEAHGGEVYLPARKAVSLSVIVNELLMNVLKHTSSQEQVHVEIGWYLNNSELIMTLRDDGPGMPESDRAGEGFGTRMIFALVKQLAGSLAVRSDHTGTAYEIRVPLDNPQRKSLAQVRP
jgi:PAS domain S-box-containing protein